MASRRDVIIGLIIGSISLFALAFMILAFIGSFSDGVEFGGMGGDVAVVEVNGVIDEASAESAIKEIDHWAERSSVKAIVIRINSPGGVVAPSQELYDAILRAREEKTVVASMGSVAASGGYLIACAAEEIVANPGTLTGSIGVIFQFHTFDGLMDKIGVGTETIKSGELKDVGTYSRPMTDREREMLQRMVMSSYEQFLAVVMAGRALERDSTLHMADGSVYTGQQAYDLGLVDTLGGLQVAVERAGELAGISGEPSVVRQYRKESISIFDLLGSFAGSLAAPLSGKIEGPQLLYLFQ